MLEPSQQPKRSRNTPCRMRRCPMNRRQSVRANSSIQEASRLKAVLKSIALFTVETVLKPDFGRRRNIVPRPACEPRDPICQIVQLFWKRIALSRQNSVVITRVPLVCLVQRIEVGQSCGASAHGTERALVFWMTGAPATPRRSSFQVSFFCAPMRVLSVAPLHRQLV